MENKELSAVLAPSFYGLHRQIRNERATHYWMAGGRGSGKSSAASVEVLLEVMRHPDANGAVLRKVGATLRDSVLGQLLWAAGALGVRDLWEARFSPLELVFTPTGQKVFLRGVDDPRKLKSLRAEKGYIRCIWYEEADEFSGPAELRSINQTLMRGGKKFTVFIPSTRPKARHTGSTGRRPRRPAGPGRWYTGPITGGCPRSGWGRRFWQKQSD